jgi:Transposase DDE domain group 1
MSDDMTLPFLFPAIRGKKVTAAFDGGRLSSDGGVMLLSEAARRMGIAEKLAAVIPDRRDPMRVLHPLPEILLARILAIACGYEDADDLDSLRADPAFKLACGRLPESGSDLMSQPTVSRWENAPTLRDLIRLGRVMVDHYCASYAMPPEAIILDIDDTLDVVHGPAAVVVQCPLRRALLSADPRLRHSDWSPGGHDPAAGQDALRGRGSRSYPPSPAGDPPSLADNPHHHPR